MRVIVWVKVGRLIYDIKVRKCPPNYITKESEYIIEVDDYTEDDIKNFLNVASVSEVDEFLVNNEKEKEVYEC
jgi:hypothetical protein